MVIKEHEEERAEMRGKGRAEWDLVQYTAKNLVCSLVLSCLSYCVEVLGKYLEKFITTTVFIAKKSFNNNNNHQCIS